MLVDQCPELQYPKTIYPIENPNTVRISNGYFHANQDPMPCVFFEGTLGETKTFAMSLEDAKMLVSDIQNAISQASL